MFKPAKDTRVFFKVYRTVLHNLKQVHIYIYYVVHSDHIQKKISLYSKAALEVDGSGPLRCTVPGLDLQTPQKKPKRD